MNSPTDPEPWLIITMQRCGGTSLSQFLDACSPHDTAQDEPFLRSRQYGFTTQRHRENPDVDRLKDDLGSVLKKRENIKHCICTAHPDITNILLDLAQELNRPVIMLMRHDEIARFRSLMIAKSTKLWFRNRPKIFNTRVQKLKSGEVTAKPINLEKVASRLIHFMELKAQTLAHIEHIGLSPIRIFYEDFYRPETLAQNAIDLANRLGMECAPDAPHLKRLMNIDPNKHRADIEKLPPNLSAFDEMLKNMQP
ncbi:hypothetical protein BFP76_00525 [Amylibacter kogurei]|uniref:Sulphotransferase Stf0 domain-containing protein n=1 Tax=Paramylibacter kogurei TaxID=1889778 RepID=A0A2G5K9F0_9RHOB|nr:hypothetical protein [Amylibacter kogurei]PIB25653.1 hypothetical protein BFP76_00525 [Amylibacter kogurei]